MRKTEPSPDTSAECGALPELHPDNMTGHIGKQAPNRSLSSALVSG
ncbi:MAG: hypothetical protein V8Q30_10855 [Acutalibacteraceae bacterium]